MEIVAQNGAILESVDDIVRNAISTLIKDFRRVAREQTAWARDLVEQEELPQRQLEEHIELMVLVYCPEVPDRYLAFVTELLAASIRLARRDRQRGVLSPQRRTIRLESLSRAG